MPARYIRKSGIRDALLCVLLFSIIYQSGTVQAANNPDDLLFRITRLLTVGIPPVLYLLKAFSFRKIVVLKYLIILFVFEALALLNFTLYSESAGILQYKIILFALLFFLSDTRQYEDKRIDNTLYKIIYFISVYTLVFYFLTDILHLPLPYTIYNRAGSPIFYRNYFGLYYSYSLARIPRLSGLFWEPGVYQIYLNLALYLFYKLEKKNRVQLTILVMNIFFTQSTSGYIIAAIILGTMFIHKKKNIYQTKVIIGIIISIIVVVGVMVVFLEKKNATNVAGDSYFDRMTQTSLGLSLFLQKPLTGSGFYNTRMYEIMDPTQSGNSNGLLTWMYTTGLIGLIIALTPFIYNAIQDKENRGKRLTWLVYILLINIVEPFYSLSIMVFFLSKEYHDMVSFSRSQKAFNLFGRVLGNENTV